MKKTKDDRVQNVLSLSPDKKMSLSIENRDGRPELWLMKPNGTEKKKISKLGKEEGVLSAFWSPDGEFIAFVSYNLYGHSPMTTTHVWVIRSDGQDLLQVILPKPYDRYSTYSPEWKTNETLIFKTQTLDDPLEQRYLYNIINRTIEKLN